MTSTESVQPAKQTNQPLETMPIPTGLSQREAERILKEVGPNQLGSERHLAVAAQLARLAGNPLVIILIIASIVSAALGEVVSSVIIVVIVLVSLILNFLQVFHSQRAADALRHLVSPKATVLRDGKWQDVALSALVPGDVIRVSAGCMTPADARLVASESLHVQQAALTGESMPVEKRVPLPGDVVSANTPEAADRIFLGTSVTSGSGTAVITATGRQTLFGDIAAHLRSRAPETEFERGMRGLSSLITRAVIFLVLFVFLVSTVLKHSTMESLLFALALAVGLTPEFLPMITTVTLGRGALRMARKKVIVKHLESIENLGSMDVLCSDKTGTLTTGNMVLEHAVDTEGHPSDAVLRLGYLNSLFETGIRNPLDDALLDRELADVESCRKEAELPFDFERRRLSVLVIGHGKRTLITKGAPESVLDICNNREVEGEIHPLTDADRSACIDTYRSYSAQGYRVLAVASRVLDQSDTCIMQSESGMTLVGFLTFANPPIPDAARLLKRLAHDGVKVKLITGDNELVTRHLCETVGLDAERIVLGDEMEKMTDSALGQVAEEVSVFARVSPAQKNRIIIALKRRGHVVGYMGDGINDAPSLHSADVGISVSTAVDVAKEAAEIILLEPGLHVLHSGILEGRRAFGNVMKYLLMNLSSNFGNMVSMAGASLFLPFLPMLPSQILLNNFLYDLSQVTIPTDTVDPEMTRKPRHWDMRLIRNFMLLIGPISSAYDFLTFYIMLNVFHSSEALFHTGWFVESLATQTLVIFVIRTARNPLKSRPSQPLLITMFLTVLVAILLPFMPLAKQLGFTALPPLYFAFLVFTTLTYLLIVEIAKRRLFQDSPTAISH